MRVAVGDALLHLLGIGGAQVGHQAALAADEVHDVLLGVCAGIAHGHQGLKADAAHALRGEHPLIVADAVHHLAADKQAGGAAAAQVQDDQAAIGQGLMQHICGAAQGHGAAVEGVAGHHTRQHRVSGYPGLIGHLVHGDGVADEGGDTQRTGDTQGQHAAQIGGMGRIADRVHEVHHVLIHQVGTGGTVGQLTAPGTDGVQRGQIHAVGGQFLFNGGLAEICLFHDPGEGAQVLFAVAHGGVKQLLLTLKEGQLGRGGAGVDDENALIHRGTPSLLLFKVSIPYSTGYPQAGNTEWI